MNDSTTPAVPDAPASGAVGLRLVVAAVVRAWAAEQVAALLDGRPLGSVPVLGTDAWATADEDTRRIAALLFVAAHYEGDDDIRERLVREVADMRAVYLADQAAQIDELHALVRDDRQALARLPTFEELRLRRREYPEPRPMVQAPGWPAPVIPGSGGRRLGELNEGAA